MDDDAGRPVNFRDFVRQSDLADFPFRTIVQARFNDVDRLGHVNNVSQVELFSEARSRLMRQLVPLSTRSDGFQFVVGQQGVAYVGETFIEQPIEIGSGIVEIGRSTMRVVQVLFNGDKPTAGAEAVLVSGKGRSQPLPPYVVAALEAYALPAGSVPRLLAS